GDAVPIDVAVDRELLAGPIVTVATAAIGQRDRAGKSVFAKKEQQIKLALDLDLTLHFVDLYNELPAHRLQQVVRVDRTFPNGSDAQYFWQPVIGCDGI